MNINLYVCITIILHMLFEKKYILHMTLFRFVCHLLLFTSIIKQSQPRFVSPTTFIYMSACWGDRAQSWISECRLAVRTRARGTATLLMLSVSVCRAIFTLNHSRAQLNAMQLCNASSFSAPPFLVQLCSSSNREKKNNPFPLAQLVCVDMLGHYSTLVSLYIHVQCLHH